MCRILIRSSSRRLRTSVLAAIKTLVHQFGGVAKARRQRWRGASLAAVHTTLSFLALMGRLVRWTPDQSGQDAHGRVSHLVWCSAGDVAQRASGRSGWTVGAGVNTAGFHVYRSDNAEGPYTRVNSQLIPAKVGALASVTYGYIDAAVEPGRTYYYQLEQ